MCMWDDVYEGSGLWLKEGGFTGKSGLLGVWCHRPRTRIMSVFLYKCEGQNKVWALPLEAMRSIEIAMSIV
jgi:hypothetical protein